MPKSKELDVELRPDGWERFEHAVDAAVKGGPKHRVAPKKQRPASKGRVRKGRSRA
ncbi:MAG: hypothetical protein ACRD2G_19135 [Terriglobia bacterium]